MDVACEMKTQLEGAPDQLAFPMSQFVLSLETEIDLELLCLYESHKYWVLFNLLFVFVILSPY